MAAANPFEDEFSCSVCFDIYQDPHTLKECFHTFCLKCIEQLEERGCVQCPECREFTNSRDIKKDFKMQRLIDLHNTQQKQGPTGDQPSTHICGMCEEPNRPVTSHCAKCNYFMCSGCVNGHKKLTELKSHTVKSITVIIRQHQSNLDKTICELKNEVKNIDTELSNVSINIQDVQQSNITNIADVKTFTADRIKALRDNEKSLEKLLDDVSDNLVKHFNQSREMLNKQKEEILSKIDLLEDLIKSQDVTTLNEKVNELNQTIHNDVRKIKVSLSQNIGHMNTNVTVQKGVNWDVMKSIQVKVGDMMCDSQWIETVLKPLYSKLYSNKYQLNKKDMLGEDLFKLCLNNDKLWGIGGNSLCVYDNDCKLVKNVKLDKINNPVSMVVSQTGYIIVACSYRGGLHQLTATGLYHSQIANGSFSDVVCYYGNIYALEHEHCKVVVFSNNKTENKWSKLTQYNLHYSSYEWDRLSVHTTSMHVSSYNDNCIYEYNTQGQFKNKIGKKGKNSPGELNHPFLCNVDSSGNVFVADWNNHRLQVCDSEGDWNIITLTGEVKKPVHAVVSEDGEIFMIQDGPPRALMKFIEY